MAPGKKTGKEVMTAALRDSIQASIDQAELGRQKEMFRKRLDVARKGLEAYQLKHHAEAVHAFTTYIQVLERWKKVQPGKLTLTNFDKKTDIQEVLLISGVYWDLCKLFSMTKGSEAAIRVRHYLHQFYIFSKGMPYEALSGETMRKFIRGSRSPHRAEFKKTYKLLTGHNCFVVTSLVDHTSDETLFRLRQFRDQKLMRTFLGRIFVKSYYVLGPALAFGMDRAPDFFRKWAARICDRVAMFLT